MIDTKPSIGYNNGLNEEKKLKMSKKIRLLKKNHTLRNAKLSQKKPSLAIRKLNCTEKRPKTINELSNASSKLEIKYKNVVLYLKQNLPFTFRNHFYI